ncbi:hypothetical protein EI534_09740 [Pseudomonas frederiksbergensis]|nr:hypothetical protein [Pseudomonas frederiksbergensis]
MGVECEPVGADLPAKAVAQSMEMRRMYWPLRGQARSHRGYRCGRNWLGATPLQRTNAWRKLAVSLNPNASAIR